MKLADYTNLKATLRLKSGLHVGTGEKVERGESTPIMKSKRTGLPYIPGSSIKGKIRHLFEITYGRENTDPRDSGSPCWCGKCQICLLFGSGNSSTTFEPSRLIFRDCFLTKETEDLIDKIGTEDKPGVRIDRTTGKAARGALFPMERIPEGVEFQMEVSVRIFDGDNSDAIAKWLEVGLFLLEQDAIGGGGTRGSGWVEIKDLELNGSPVKDWRDEAKRIKGDLSKLSIKK